MESKQYEPDQTAPLGAVWSGSILLRKKYAYLCA